MKIKSDNELLNRGVENVINKAHLAKSLQGSKKLRVKLGIDPTGDKLHIGSAVVLWKLKAFQDLGHTAVLIVGDFTAQIGDPSDKLSKRPMLTEAQIKQNLKTYVAQIGKILNLQKTEVHYNSTWLKKFTFKNISELAELFSVQQMLARRNFSERFKKQEEISMRELMYPLMQGYDSVAVKADVELGGTDQLFNLLAGRAIQEHYKQKPQDIMTTKMLIGFDGRKMSKSWGNTINITDEPNDQFGKIMSMHDEIMPEYFELATDLLKDSILEIKKMPARDQKARLAFEIVKSYHGERRAHDAQKNFESLFSKKEIPDDIAVLRLSEKSISASELVMRSGVAKSKSEAQRLITQGGLKINDKVVQDSREELTSRKGDIVKIGKKRFFRIQ